jgi:hypothetical protein
MIKVRFHDADVRVDVASHDARDDYRRQRLTSTSIRTPAGSLGWLTINCIKNAALSGKVSGGTTWRGFRGVVTKEDCVYPAHSEFDMCSDILSIISRPRLNAIAVLAKCGMIVAAAILLAACGLQKDAPRCGSGHAARHASSGECAPSRLRIRLDGHASAVVAGFEYRRLDFTDTAAACGLGTVPVVTLADAGQD